MLYKMLVMDPRATTSSMTKRIDGTIAKKCQPMGT